MILQVLATGSRGNCYALRNGNNVLLLDAGIGAEKIKEGIGFRVRDVAGCLITHKHKDHCKGAEGLYKLGIALYGGIETASDIPHLQTTSGAFSLGEFSAKPFPVPHCDPNGEPCPNYGWLITNNLTKERMVYVTDTCHVANPLPGLHYWLIECNYDDNLLEGTHPALAARLSVSHMSVKRLCATLKRNDLTVCKRIVLCHGSRERLDPAIACDMVHKATEKPVEVAVAGLRTPLEMEPF